MTWNGPAVRAIREAQNLGLRSLAASTGLDRGYLSRLERGLVSKPSPDKVERIAAALRVPPDVIDPRKDHA
ncbi:helix-turn-helix transcriptional regulator [Streptomyces sp. E11-3]|uniref:helix-turn-helix domain-containing protein n=1 Tax=Streptomyces sp. E11-3 TaxID=3110112 RepID=UPI0039804757